METYETRSSYRGDMFDADEPSGIKDRLGRLGRRIKHVDLRSQIVEHPFLAVGIAAGAGALVGLARPMPQRGPVSGALIAALTAIGFRLVREAAFTRLGQYARDLLSQDDQPRARPNPPPSGSEHSRYGH